MLVGKAGRKRHLGRYTHRWDDNIKVNFKEIEYEEVDWIHLACCKIQWWTVVNKVILHGLSFLVSTDTKLKWLHKTTYNYSQMFKLSHKNLFSMSSLLNFWSNGHYVRAFWSFWAINKLLQHL
jgi:hypothetical protein